MASPYASQSLVFKKWGGGGSRRPLLEETSRQTDCEEEGEGGSVRAEEDSMTVRQDTLS